MVKTLSAKQYHINGKVMSKKSKPHFIDVATWANVLGKELESESDRGLAIISGSLLDEMLAILLQGFFIKDEGFHDVLFGVDRPLGTFSSKVNLTYALGLISSDEKKEIDIIRKIRNDFAHSLQSISFSDQSIKDRCANLVIPDRMFVPDFIPLPNEGDESIPTIDLTPPKNWKPRDRFTNSVTSVLRNLSVRYAQVVRSHRSIPKEFESPENMWRDFLAEADLLVEHVRDLEKQKGIVPEELPESFKSVYKITQYFLAIIEHSREHKDN
jgi:DNA-binding MltR family transcriptional regulator